MNTKKYLKLAIELLERVKFNDIEYVYRRQFTDSITEKILTLAETNLQQNVNKTVIQKRIYFIMVEGLQNVIRHQEAKVNQDSENKGIFIIQKIEDNYLISTGNLIDNNQIEALNSKLKVINSLNKVELKAYYKKILTNEEISEKGGAGLGLIEMARKSGNKLQYEFYKLDEKHSYFYQQTEILAKKNAPPNADSETNNSLDNVKKLHLILKKENILINFNGGFNQENLINLLSIIKDQGRSKSKSRKLYKLIVELIQNIIKHGYKPNPDVNFTPGIFFLSEKKDCFYLITANFIKNEIVDKLKSKLDYINNLNMKELSKFYNEVLLNFDEYDSKRTGLGFIDMKLKSNNNINYYFENKDDKKSNLVLQITLKK